MHFEKAKIATFYPTLGGPTDFALEGGGSNANFSPFPGSSSERECVYFGRSEREREDESLSRDRPAMDFRPFETPFFGDNLFRDGRIGIKFSHSLFQLRRQFLSV